MIDEVHGNTYFSEPIAFEIDDGEALGKTFFRKYSVVTSKCDMGFITLELRYYDE